MVILVVAEALLVFSTTSGVEGILYFGQSDGEVHRFGCPDSEVYMHILNMIKYNKITLNT